MDMFASAFLFSSSPIFIFWNYLPIKRSENKPTNIFKLKKIFIHPKKTILAVTYSSKYTYEYNPAGI